MMALERSSTPLKHLILGNARSLMRQMSDARAESTPAVMAYNLKQVSKVMGAAWMHQSLRE